MSKTKVQNLIAAALIVSTAFVMSACGNKNQGMVNQPAGSGNPSATGGQDGAVVADQNPAHGPAPLDGNTSKSTVSLVGAPVLSKDGSAINITVTVTNQSGVEYASGGTNPVNLGTQTVDQSGKVNTEFVRTHIPTIPAGGSADVKISVPADGALDKSLKIMLVQEGINWFDAWGQQPVLVGPFTKCDAGVCSDNKPLTKQQ